MWLRVRSFSNSNPTISRTSMTVSEAPRQESLAPFPWKPGIWCDTALHSSRKRHCTGRVSLSKQSGSLDRRWRRSGDIRARMQARLTFVAAQGYVACAHLLPFQSNPRFVPLVCRMPYVWRDDINDFDRSIGSFDSTRLRRRTGRAPRVFSNAGDLSVSEFSASEYSQCNVVLVHAGH
jgi:hypothetical protein